LAELAKQNLAGLIEPNPIELVDLNSTELVKPFLPELNSDELVEPTLPKFNLIELVELVMPISLLSPYSVEPHYEQWFSQYLLIVWIIEI